MSSNYVSTNFNLPLRSGFDSAFAYRVTVGDFTGDGKIDVVVTYAISPAVNQALPIRVLAGDGQGGFTDQTSALFAGAPPQTVHPRELVVADLNGDGRPDLFVADQGQDSQPFPGAQNSLMLSSGATGLINAVARLPQASDFTHSAAAADIDGDGDLDLYVGNESSPGPYFLLNNGAAVFTPATDRLPASVTTQMHFTTSAFFDADGDGDQDLFLGAARQDGVSLLLLNDGHGRFAEAAVRPPVASVFVPGSDAIDAQAIDLDGDGLKDLVVGYTIGADGAKFYTQILMNRGGGVLVDETAQRIPADFQNISLTRGGPLIVDINGDGYKDLLLADGTAAPLALNDGTGHFIHMPAGVIPGGAGDTYGVGDVNGDGRLDLISWWGRGNGQEFMRVDLWKEPAASQVGTAGADVLIAGGAASTLNGGGGDDILFGGNGVDVAVYGGRAVDFSVTHVGHNSWRIADLRSGAPEGADLLVNVEIAQFTDQAVTLGVDLPQPAELAFAQVTRSGSSAAGNLSLATRIGHDLNTGALSQVQAAAQIVKAAGATSSVATLAYEFFTGKAPSAAGMDYLVSPTGPNPNNLNSAYYQSFSLENRYINFAVNLGKLGDGKAAFTAAYGGLSLFDATRQAYTTIFGAVPSDAKIHALLDPTAVLGGQTLTRADYFAYYGQDGANGVGTKAAMVGWLLSEAVKADLGPTPFPTTLSSPMSGCTTRSSAWISSASTPGPSTCTTLSSSL